MGKLNSESNLVARRAQAVEKQKWAEQKRAQDQAAKLEAQRPLMRGIGIAFFVLGLFAVLSSWLAVAPGWMGWVGFGLSAFGQMCHVARQPSWVKGLATVGWLMGFILVVAGWSGEVSADVAWVGLAITVAAGAIHFVDIERD